MSGHCFTIWGQLPGLNQMVAADRRHWAVGGKLKKQWTNYCAMCAVKDRVEPIRERVIITFAWFEPNMRRDLDNIAAGSKYILDGLVKARILRSDGRKWVLGINHRFKRIDPLNPRIEVSLDPV